LLYERLGDNDTAANYMELTIQQETGLSPDDDDDDTSTVAADGDVPGTASSRRTSTYSHKSNEAEEEQVGTGVTASTSKARLWLAKWALQHHDLDRADQLASELCQDGIEVDEAKAIIRDVHSRRVTMAFFTSIKRVHYSAVHNQK
ncbi:hypothetical protein KEM56_003664, partial [Ascosphaera pollenicola]